MTEEEKTRIANGMANLIIVISFAKALHEADPEGKLIKLMESV